MDPTALLDRLRPDPYETGARRLIRRVGVDSAVLRNLRRACDNGDERAFAVYGWALGVVPDEVEAAGPLTAARAWEQAAAVAPDNAAIQFGNGLAHAGGFGRRRGLPLDARRGFGAAARLDPDNATAHLALAVARLSTGNREQADQSIDAALAAPRFVPYDSPLAEPIRDAAPWLGWSLATLWPARTSEAQRYLLDSLLTDAAVARQRTGDTAGVLRRVAGLGRAMIERGADHPGALYAGTGAVMLALSAREKLLRDQNAPSVREKLAAVTVDLARRERELGRAFEKQVGLALGTAAVGGAAGLGVGIAGWLKSREAMLWLAHAAGGRTWLVGGLGLAVVGVAAPLTPNPVSAARRRTVELHLVAREAAMVTEARAALVAILDEAVITIPKQATAAAAPRRSA